MSKCPSCGTQNLEDNSYCGRCGCSLTGQTGQLSANTVLEGRYVIVGTLGRGGMGAVYKALDQRLKNTPVAIKEMSTKAVAQGNLKASIDAFEKEAGMLISLRHPALPRITDFFSKGEDRWYLVMDFIEGETLKAVAEKRGPIPEPEVLDWAGQLCEILDYLHSQKPQVIFRDLKPSNIMLTPDGKIKLIDFGIARHFSPGLSSDTAAYGSPGYSPPEQHGVQQTDIRSDIFALGATLHHLLTGVDPGRTPFVFEPPSKLVKITPGFESIIMSALELKPDNRPGSAKEVLSSLTSENMDETNRLHQKEKDIKIKCIPQKHGATIFPDDINKHADKTETLSLDSSEQAASDLDGEGEITEAINVIPGYSPAGQKQTKNNISYISRKKMIAAVVSLLIMLAAGGWYGYDLIKSNRGSDMTSASNFIPTQIETKEAVVDNSQAVPSLNDVVKNEDKKTAENKTTAFEVINLSLINAIEKGDYSGVESTLRDGANPNARDRNGFTPLMYAAGNNNVSILKLLINAGADPNAIYQGNNNSVLYFAFFGHEYPYIGRTEFMTILLEAGANPNYNNGRLPILNSAAGERDTETIKLMLNFGANPNILDDTGGTPLHKYFSSLPLSNLEIINILIENGVDVNKRDNNGETALGLIRRFSSSVSNSEHLTYDITDAVDILIKAGAVE